MKTLESLYFPDTAILSERQLPVFLLFSRVNIIAPVEHEDTADDRSKDTFMDSRFCQVHTPHPLGEDRKRFLYLIDDIKNRKDDYAAQLSHLTLASMSAKPASNQEAGHQILSSLLGNKQSADDEEKGKETDILWQARLVLKIGEILDREEEEVARSLVLLDKSETDLFDRLKGEDDDEQDVAELSADLSKIRAKLDKPRTEQITKRLRAWFRLTRNAELPECPVWSTTRAEVADILSENHEKAHGRGPKVLGSLALPATLDFEGHDLLTRLEDFHAQTHDTLRAVVEHLINNHEKISAQEEPKEAAANWQKMIDGRYPENIYGRTTVHFYRFHKALANYSGLKHTGSGISETPTILALFAV